MTNLAAKKKKLVQISGPKTQLDTFLQVCCADGSFEPEQAMRYMSASLGYTTLSEENPYPTIIQQFEDLATQIGQPLMADETIGNMTVEDANELIDQVRTRFHSLYTVRRELLDQRSACVSGAENYSHFRNLQVNIDDVTNCEYVAVRFGFLPTVGYQKLMAQYADDPYILFMRCEETDQGYWGVYFTPKEKQREVDGIFSMLYFERVIVPGAAGTPEEIIVNFESNIKILDEQLAETDRQIRAIWEEEKSAISRAYRAAQKQAEVFALRRFAACKGKIFVYVGWIPTANEKQFVSKLEGIENLRVNVKDPPKETHSSWLSNLKSRFRDRSA